MSECPECGMRDDDWFLCRRQKCATKTISNNEGEIADLKRQLAEARAERKELKSAFDARVQEMSERFRAVNVAEALKQLGPDHLAMAERLQAAEAERDRLASDNARLVKERDEKIARALAKADYEAERAGDIENENDRLADELRAVRAQLDTQLAGHRLSAKDATKQLLRATHLEDAITRVVDPAPGCNCPPWILGILKAALAGKE